jgi:hypothetical protein
MTVEEKNNSNLVEKDNIDNASIDFSKLPREEKCREMNYSKFSTKTINQILSS